MRAVFNASFRSLESYMRIFNVLKIRKLRGR